MAHLNKQAHFHSSFMDSNNVASLSSYIDFGFDHYKLDMTLEGVARRWELVRWLEQSRLLGDRFPQSIAAALTWLCCLRNIKNPPSESEVAKLFKIDESTVIKTVKFLRSKEGRFLAHVFIVYRVHKKKKLYYYFSIPKQTPGVVTPRITHQNLREQIRLRLGLKDDLIDYEMRQDGTRDWQSLSTIRFKLYRWYCLEELKLDRNMNRVKI